MATARVLSAIASALLSIGCSISIVAILVGLGGLVGCILVRGFRSR